MKVQENILEKNILKDKIKGAVFGFLIGDALGLPTAGIKAQEIKKTIGYVYKYIVNPYHPFFYFLKKGQYGSNGRLLVISLELIIKNKGFNYKDIKKRLYDDAIKSQNSHFYSRFSGETILTALLNKKPSKSSSITCLYGTIPIALFYNDWDKIVILSEKQAKITHTSNLSLASTLFINYLIFKLRNKKEINKNDIELIVKDGLNYIIKKYSNIDILTKRIKKILNNKIKDINQARKVFGTGSLAYQSIPLSIYILCKHFSNFEKAVVLGANSYRDDDKDEKKRLANYSYIRQMLECKGGNTDAIGALVGCLIGCIGGYRNIPSKFIKDIENRDKINKFK